MMFVLIYVTVKHPKIFEVCSRRMLQHVPATGFTHSNVIVGIKIMIKACRNISRTNLKDRLQHQLI